MLAASLYPWTPTQFFKKVYQKKAFVIKGQPKGRFDQVIAEQMFDLQLGPLVEATADSEEIHIWQPAKKKGQKIQSRATDDVAECVKAVKKGASLYFTSSADFRNTYGKALSHQMGYDFAGYFPGSSTGQNGAGDSMTEIEIFIAKKGNYTDWHMDFQENITFQLKGTKKWRLKTEPGMKSPVTGFSPHFKQTGNLELQAKTIQAYNGVDIAAKYDKAKLEKGCTEVTLEAGDILYHPAGIWHSVESVSDSISINFSMRQVRGADFVVNALRMHLLTDLQMRQGLRFAPGDVDNTSFIADL